jgi:hypothetical protein
LHHQKKRKKVLKLPVKVVEERVCSEAAEVEVCDDVEVEECEAVVGEDNPGADAYKTSFSLSIINFGIS